MEKTIDALTALARLREGNRRFVAGQSILTGTLTHRRRTELVSEQAPFAIVLGCSDSRAPAEIVFDQGLGELFVIRVAGNIIAPSLVGSVEFAALQFRTRLVVVLGHTHCGAVEATVDAVLQANPSMSLNLTSIVDRIKPAVLTLADTDLRNDREAFIEHAVRANVRIAASHLRHSSAILENLIEQDGLLVVGAEYSLETGLVEFFDGMPSS